MKLNTTTIAVLAFAAAALAFAHVTIPAGCLAGFAGILALIWKPKHG